MIYKIHPLFFLFAFMFASCSQSAFLDEPYNEFESVKEEWNVLDTVYDRSTAMMYNIL